MSFLKELKRRNVVRVGIAYVIGAWLLLQFTEVLSELLSLPKEIGPIVVAIVAIGLPIALFLAWAYELTPEGVKRESEVDRNQSVTASTGKKLNAAIVVMLSLAVVYLLYDKFSVDETAPRQSASEVVQPQSGIEQEPEAEVSRLSIAVLPFDNRSDQTKDEFFVEGIHDDLLTTIAKIGSMKVISRTSVMEYKDTTKKIPDIAAELGVANILEGGIQRSGNQVRINVQLIDAQTDEHLWAETYDRELTAENLFGVQSEISRAIADALHATLSPEEERRIDTAPTDNLLANEHYLRGRQLMATRESKAIVQSSDEFRKAVKLDPDFALAWVGIADSLDLSADYSSMNLESTYAERNSSIERALGIDSQMGEAYASLGALHTDKQELKQAEAALTKATELNPNYSTAWHWLAGFLGRNYPLRIDDGITAGKRAVELDPRSAIIRLNLGGMYGGRGLYSMAEGEYRKVTEMHPGFAPGAASLAVIYSEILGRHDLALTHAIRAHDLDPNSSRIMSYLREVYWNLGFHDRVLAIVELQQEINPDPLREGAWEMNFNLLEKNWAGALENARWLYPLALKTENKEAMMTFGNLEFALGDAEQARGMYLAAEPGWIDPKQWGELLRQYGSNACNFAWILRSTGEEALAGQLFEQSIYYHEVTLPVVREHVEIYSPDICYLGTGYTQKFLESIELRLAHNHIGVDWLWALPVYYDSIRLEPRYLAAVEEVNRRLEEQRSVAESFLIENGL